MGRQEGLLQFTGGVGNLSFHKSQDGYLVRKKSGVSRERIMSDRAYVRTRENIAEFGTGARATKLLRRSFSPLIRTVADNRVTSRLTSAVVMKVIKSDATNPRGQRNVENGDLTLLEGFEFNRHAALANAFGSPFTASIDRATGGMQIHISSFIPANVITGPEGATHFRLKAFGAAIDFDADAFLTSESESPYLPISNERQTGLTLSHTVASGSDSPLLLAFGIEFVQLVNGVRYPLKDEKKNAMAVVKVDRADRNGVRGRGEIRKVTASPDDLCNSGRVSFTRLPRRRDGAKDRGGCDMVSRFRRQRFALHINRLHLQVEDFVMAVKFWALARAPARLVGLKPGENSIPRTTS